MTEVEKLMNAAKDNRHGHRDTTMVLVAYRHGLRASELVDHHEAREALALAVAGVTAIMLIESLILLILY